METTAFYVVTRNMPNKKVAEQANKKKDEQANKPKKNRKNKPKWATMRSDCVYACFEIVARHFTAELC